MARYINVDDFFQDYEPLLTWDLIDAMNKSVSNGKWIPLDQRVAKCSECGYVRCTNGSDLTGKALVHRALFKFCENCGARMDGE